MNPNTYQLKTINPYFSDVFEGRKTFEVRREGDRHFRVGDVVELVECDYLDGGPLVPTGRNVNVEITHLIRGPFGRDGINGEAAIAFGWVVFSFRVRSWKHFDRWAGDPRPVYDALEHGFARLAHAIRDVNAIYETAGLSLEIREVLNAAAELRAIAFGENLIDAQAPE